MTDDDGDYHSSHCLFDDRISAILARFEWTKTIAANRDMMDIAIHYIVHRQLNIS